MSGSQTSAIRQSTNRLIQHFLQDSADALHRRLGDVAGVAVSTAEGSMPRTLAASTVLASDVDRIQFAIGTGPCLETLRVGRGMYVADLGADERWGAYGPLAAARGAACCCSVPVLVRGSAAAVFKVYAGERDGLSASQQATAALAAVEIAGGFELAAHVSSQASELEDLTAVLTHRRVIDLAIGISMERAQVPSDAAFDLLRVQSQHRNLKLHEVAGEVVTSIPGTSVVDLIPHFNPHA